MILEAFHGWPGQQRNDCGENGDCTTASGWTNSDRKRSYHLFSHPRAEGGRKVGGRGFVSPSHSYIYIFFCMIEML